MTTYLQDIFRTGKHSLIVFSSNNCLNNEQLKENHLITVHTDQLLDRLVYCDQTPFPWLIPHWSCRLIRSRHHCFLTLKLLPGAVLTPYRILKQTVKTQINNKNELYGKEDWTWQMMGPGRKIPAKRSRMQERREKSSRVGTVKSSSLCWNTASPWTARCSPPTDRLLIQALTLH